MSPIGVRGWGFGTGCMAAGTDRRCPYQEAMDAILDALAAAGKRGRARSGLEREIRDAAHRRLGWDIGADLASRTFAGAIDEFIRHGVRIPSLANRRGTLTFYFPDPTEGSAATTPVEARGTSSPARDSRRERNPRYDAARAAGAQVTGQCQDGQSQAPADAQYPAPAHGRRGAHLPSPVTA